MARAARQMHLGIFVLGTGNHTAGWMQDGASTSNCSLPVMRKIAETAERARFDLFFLGDNLAMDPADHPSFISRLEPITALSALSTMTSHIGLGATMSTSFSEPFHVARTFASLDHVSGGRAAWNVVTSTKDAAALNFSQDRLKEHDLRYEIASEFVEVVRGLWDTWEDGAILADRASGKFVDAARVRTLDHKGRFFAVRGPLNIERSPQGHPVVIQAGGSGPGQDLSARQADIVFSVVSGDPDAAKQAYDGLKQRIAAAGRDPALVAILPGVMPIIGATRAEARDRLARLQGGLASTSAMALVSERLGHDISKFPLDGPIPDFPETTERSRTFSKTLIEKARRENMTLRDLYNLTAAARGHWVLCGTPADIADSLEDWFTAGRADGFMIQPPYFPDPFDEFADTVVPELQRRGLVRTEYTGPMLRDHLGLARR